MLVKKEELINLISLGNRDMILLVANNPENVGAEINNTSICSQDEHLLDNGIITVNKKDDCISLSNDAVIGDDGVSIYNLYCYKSFFKNKDIAFLFTDFVSLCMLRGYELFRCFIQDNDNERIVSFAVGIPVLVLGATKDEISTMASNLLNKVIEELNPFLESITEETPQSEGLETFGYNIIPFKDPNREEFYIEINPIEKSIKLLATELEGELQK